MLGVSTLPSDIAYQGLMLALSYLFCFLCWLKSVTCFLGVELPHTSPCSKGDCLGTTCTLVGELQLGQCPLVPSLPCPGIHLRSCIERVPLDTEVSCAWQIYGVTSKVCSTLYIPPKWYTDKSQHIGRYTG